MIADDWVLISVDDHIVEPADVFVGRLPLRYRERAPCLIQRPDGANVALRVGAWVVTG